MRDIFLGQLPGFLFGLVASAIGAWIAHRFNERRLRREEFNRAAAAFRYALLPEFMFLKHNVRVPGAGSADNLCELLMSAYVGRHLMAFETFLMHLPSGKRDKFSKAWKDYCHYDVEGEPGDPFFEQYFEERWEGRPTKELALERINRLLSFAAFG